MGWREVQHIRENYICREVCQQETAIAAVAATEAAKGDTRANETSSKRSRKQKKQKGIRRHKSK